MGRIQVPASVTPCVRVVGCDAVVLGSLERGGRTVMDHKSHSAAVRLICELVCRVSHTACSLRGGHWVARRSRDTIALASSHQSCALCPGIRRVATWRAPHGQDGDVRRLLGISLHISATCACACARSPPSCQECCESLAVRGASRSLPLGSGSGCRSVMKRRKWLVRQKCVG